MKKEIKIKKEDLEKVKLYDLFANSKKQKISLKSKKLLLRYIQNGGNIEDYFKIIKKKDFYYYLKNKGENFEVQKNLRKLIEDEERAGMLNLQKWILVINTTLTFFLVLITILNFLIKK